MPKWLSAGLPLSMLLIAACTSQQQAKTESQITGAVTAPLADFNIIRAEVPAILVAARRYPYAPPADSSCFGLAAELRQLDMVLGADLDTPATAVNPGLIERGTELITDATFGKLRGLSTSVVPYRGWVRKVSGAEKYAQDVQAGIAAGGVRRSFLKGFGQAKGCEPPAAPRYVEY